MNTAAFHLVIGALLLPLAVCVAQPAYNRDGVQASVRVSHTLDASFENAPGGELSLKSVEVGLRGSKPISPATRLLFGVTVARHDLDVSGPALLPNRLLAVGFPLGVAHRSSDAWRWIATAQPRYAGAPNLGDGGLDVPVIALATYTASSELTWSVGLRYSRRSSVELLPTIGATWNFAPKWEAKLAFPETGVFYRHSAALNVGGIVELHGGDFLVGDDSRPLGNRAGGSLSGSWLEYRQVRTGLSAQYAMSGSLALRADAGYAVVQRFEYQRPNLTIEADGSPYVAVGLTARF